MSKRKTRQVIRQADYRQKRSAPARWLVKHRETCGACRNGSVCRLISQARSLTMFEGVL